VHDKREAGGGRATFGVGVAYGHGAGVGDRPSLPRKPDVRRTVYHPRAEFVAACSRAGGPTDRWRRVFRSIQLKEYDDA